MRVVPPPSIEAVPVLTFDEALHLYTGLLEQSHRLDDYLQVIRKEILRTMGEMRVTNIREEDFEVMRQVRHRAPKINVEKAEALLKRFRRLQECLVPGLDEERARKVLEELKAAGEIKEEQLPYEYLPETEVLVVRRVGEESAEL